MAANPNAAAGLGVAAAATAARAKLPTPAQQKAKYGEITMMDFPQFTKDTFPGVTHMDLYSALFGDVTDDSMFFPQTAGGPRGFDPLEPFRTEMARQACREGGEHGNLCSAHLE